MRGIRADLFIVQRGVAEQLLDGADVAAVLEQMRGEGVAEGVAGRALRDAQGEDCPAHGLLEDGLVQMVGRRWPVSGWR